MEDVEIRIRDRLSKILRRPLSGWDADLPLSDAAETGYDSMIRLEVLIAIEDEFGVSGLPKAGDLDTIAAITRYVAEALKEVSS